MATSSSCPTNLFGRSCSSRTSSSTARSLECQKRSSSWTSGPNWVTLASEYWALPRRSHAVLVLTRVQEAQEGIIRDVELDVARRLVSRRRGDTASETRPSHPTSIPDRKRFVKHSWLRFSMIDSSGYERRSRRCQPRSSTYVERTAPQPPDSTTTSHRPSQPKHLEPTSPSQQSSYGPYRQQTSISREGQRRLACRSCDPTLVGQG